MKKEATVIIPAYNEEKNIQKVIRRVRATGNYEIIIVDDGSKDRTAALSEEEKAVVIRLEKNSGKGFACLVGSRKAGSEKIVFIDADLQLKPEEIPKFVAALDSCDVAIGVREMKDIPIQRRIANIIAQKIISVPVKDALCGFRAVRKGALEKMQLKTRRYEFESEMLLAAVRNGMRIAEVPVTVSYESSKGMGMLDGLKVIVFILKSRVRK